MMQQALATMHTVIVPAGEHKILSIPIGMQEIVYHIESDAQCVIIDHDDENAQNVHRTITFYCARNAELIYYTSMIHALRYTQQIRIVLQGQYARARIQGLYVLNDTQRVGLQVRQEHLAPDTHSDVLCKGVLAGAAQALYEGTIYIDYAAHRSHANQQNKNLLLGDHAQARSIPALEVLTNDVSCKHGSAVGQLDPLQLFYMQSRGLDIQEAQRLLISGFIADVLKERPGLDDGQLLARIMQKL